MRVEPFNLHTPLIEVESRTVREQIKFLLDSFRSELKLPRDMLALTLQRMACFDYSFELLVLSYVIAQVQNEQGDTTDSQAAANLIIYFLNFGVAFALYPLLPFIKIGSRLMGEVYQATEMKDYASKYAAQRKYSRLVRTSLLVGIGPAALSSALMFNAEWVCGKLGQDPAVSRLLGQFTRPGSILLPIFMMRFLSDLLLFLNGKGHIVMGVTLGCWGLSGFGLSYVLTLGKWSLPKMGIPGAFTGFLGQILGSWLILNSVVKFSPSFEDYSFLGGFCKWTKDDRKQIKEFIPLSAAYLATISTELLSQLATNLLVGRLPPSRSAAQNFWTWILFFSILFGQGLAQVGNQLVGDALGKKNLPLAQRTAKLAVMMAIALPAPAYIAFSVDPHLLMGLMQSTVNTEVQELGVPVIRAACVYSVLTTGQFVMIEILKQTDKYVRPVALSITGLWVGVGVSYLLSEAYGYDGIGVNYGAVVGAGLSLAATAGEFKRQFIDKPVVQTEASPDLETGFEEPSNARPVKLSLSSNRYGCWNSFSRIYNRLFGSRQELEQSPQVTLQ